MSAAAKSPYDELILGLTPAARAPALALSAAMESGSTAFFAGERTKEAWDAWSNAYNNLKLQDPKAGNLFDDLFARAEEAVKPLAAKMADAFERMQKDPACSIITTWGTGPQVPKMRQQPWLSEGAKLSAVYKNLGRDDRALRLNFDTCKSVAGQLIPTRHTSHWMRRTAQRLSGSLRHA
eukprot:6184970-Pleurochrysis_carterae.AAC.3